MFAFPSGSDELLTNTPLVLRSVRKYSPLLNCIWACLLEVKRSGSTSTQVLSGARPMVPPVSKAELISWPGFGLFKMVNIKLIKGGLCLSQIVADYV